MTRFSLDVQRLKHFVNARQNFQWLVIITFGALLFFKLFQYNYRNKPVGGLIIFSFVFLVWLGFVWLLKRFKSMINTFYGWDKDLVVTICDKKMLIESKLEIKEYEISKLKVRNYIFYGRRAISYNPLNGLGFVEIESKNEVRRISNLVFGMGEGFENIRRLFQNKAGSYEEFTMNWFKRIPTTPN